MKKFPYIINEKINKIKLFKTSTLIMEVYNQKEFLRNDTLITTMIFDCIKIIIFVYNYEFSFNKDYLTAVYQGNIDYLNVKYVSYSYLLRYLIFYLQFMN